MKMIGKNSMYLFVFYVIYDFYETAKATQISFIYNRASSLLYVTQIYNVIKIIFS